MFNRILSKIGEAAKSPQASPRSPSHDLDDDLNSSASAEGFLCPSCMLAFPSAETLQNHYEISHGQEVNGTSESRTQFLCPACKMRFTCDQELQSHFSRHHTEKGQKSSDELSSLRKDLDELQTSLKEERLYSEDLKKELGRVQTTLQGAGEESNQATLEVYRNQIRTLEESKTLALSEIVLLKQHLEENRSDKELLKEEKSKLEQKTATLAGEYATVQAHLDELKSENDLLKSKLSTTEIEREKLTFEIHQRLGAEDAALLRQELVSVQKMMDTLTLQSESEKESFMKQCKILEEEKVQLEQHIVNLQQRDTSYIDKSELEVALQDQATVRQELEKEKGEVTVLQDKCAALQTELLQKNAVLQEEISKTVKHLETQQDLNHKMSQIGLERERLGFQLAEKDKESENLRTEVGNVKELCASLNSKKEELQQQLMKANTRASDFQRNAEKSNIQLTNLQEECGKLKDTVERMETERKELCTQIEAGDGAKTAITQLQQENASLQEQLQQQIQSTASSNKKFQQQLETLTKQLQEMNLEHNTLVNKEEKTRAILQETRTTLAEAKATAEKYLQELKDKNEKLLASETSNSMLKTNLENKSQQLTVVKSKLENVSADLVRLQGESRALTEKLQQEQMTNKKLKEDSSKQIKSLSSEKDSLAATLKASQENANKFQRQLKEKEEQWNQIHLDLNTKIQAGEARLREEMEIRRNENLLSVNKQEGLEREISNLQQELSDVKTSLEMEQQEKSSTKRDLENCVSERDALITAKQELEARVSSLENEVKEERQMKEKSQQQLNTCQAQLIESQEHASRVNKALDDLQELKEEMAERIQQLESDCAQLSQAKENLTTLKVKLEHQLEERCKKEQDLVAKTRTLEQKNAKLHEEFVAEKLLAQKGLSECNALKEAAVVERDKVQSELSSTVEQLKNVKVLHQSELSEAKSKITNLDKLLQDAHNELTKSQQLYSELELQLEEERSQHEAQVCILQENQATLRQDLSQQQDRAEDLQARLADISGQKLELDAKLENALDERRALLERCLGSEEECDKLRSATGELRNKLDDTLAALHELGRENQTLQIENAKLLQRKWTDDSEVTHCTACKKLFTVTLRKHHCRSCGNIFCNDCSSKTATLASFKKPVRVCESCFEEVSV